MAWSCASRGQCDARTLREFLFFYQSSPSQSQLIAEYHHALTRAAREGDWSYFTVHNGPAPQAAMFGPPPPPKPPAGR
jgi:sulfur relay (sulfurtransferase) DsrC/TusE family protein